MKRFSFKGVHRTLYFETTDPMYVTLPGTITVGVNPPMCL